MGRSGDAMKAFERSVGASLQAVIDAEKATGDAAGDAAKEKVQDPVDAAQAPGKAGQPGEGPETTKG
jgi:hypothetical protein